MTCFFPLLTIAFAAILISGCAGGGSATATPTGGSTTVVLLASSTANDQAILFNTTLESLTLTSQSGNKVSVLASPVGDEFSHLNGHVEPLITVTIPQDTYVSATATFGNTFSGCAAQYPGTSVQDGFPANPSSTVTLPSPITVTGTSMGLVLNLQIATLQGGCPTVAQYPFSTGFLSSFNLTSVALATPSSTSASVTAPGLQGLVTSVDAGGSGFTVGALVNGGEVLNAPTWHAAVNGNTVFETIGSVSQLAVGQPVDMDLAIQPDGSLLAKRVEVISTNTTTLTAVTGSPILVNASVSLADILGAGQKGYLPTGEGGFGPVNLSGSTFQISSQLANLGTLPFTASFNAANMVAGQNITFTTQATALTSGSGHVPVSTMTLMPQTINGTVSAISKSGNFTIYTVTLAGYDLFPQFATQPGQTTVLTNPTTVTVYADSNAQMLNSSAVGVGALLRFYGLVFNDSGALRMDCAQISNGVAE